MTRTPEDVLQETQAHFALMVQHAQGNLADQLVIDAICLRLSAGVEALARLDTATRDRLFGDAWPLLWGMRNRIARCCVRRRRRDEGSRPGCPACAATLAQAIPAELTAFA